MITASECIVSPLVDPSLIKFIRFARIIDGVSHLFDAKLDSSSIWSSLFIDFVAVELGEIVGVGTDCWAIKGCYFNNWRGSREVGTKSTSSSMN